MTRAAFGRSVCKRRPAPAVPVALAVALPAAPGGTPGLACQWCRLSTREAVSFVGAKGANGLAQEDMIATSLAPLTAARGSAGGATPVSVAYRIIAPAACTCASPLRPLASHSAATDRATWALSASASSCTSSEASHAWSMTRRSTMLVPAWPESIGGAAERGESVLHIRIAPSSIERDVRSNEVAVARCSERATPSAVNLEFVVTSSTTPGEVPTAPLTFELALGGFVGGNGSDGGEGGKGGVGGEGGGGGGGGMAACPSSVCTACARQLVRRPTASARWLTTLGPMSREALRPTASPISPKNTLAANTVSELSSSGTEASVATASAVIIRAGALIWCTLTPLARALKSRLKAVSRSAMRALLASPPPPPDGEALTLTSFRPLSCAARSKAYLETEGN